MDMTQTEIEQVDNKVDNLQQEVDRLRKDMAYLEVRLARRIKDLEK